MKEKKAFSNPKLMYEKNKFVFKYYAGYSSEFVEDVINRLNIKENEIILDPWNGSGTTTSVASKKGFFAVGLDINPVMSIISKSRLLNKHEVNLLELKSVISSTKRYKKKEVSDKDMLLLWFDKDSVKIIRNLDRSIQSNVLNMKNAPKILFNEINSIDSKGSFYYVVFFEVIKSFLLKFKASNPTWIKKAKTIDEKIKITEENLILKFQEIFNIFYSNMNDDNNMESTISLKINSSQKMDVENNYIDYIITSPPYCTRIDYAIATRIELSIIGYTEEMFENLRKEMIGTTKILKNTLKSDSIGEYARVFLKKVYYHPSKASKSYYYKQFLQYFEGIFNSFEELNRVLKDNGKATFVVQDSYYKDIHLDLSLVFNEIANNFSWDLLIHEKYKPKNNMAKINAKSSNYEKNQDLLEHVLVYEKRRT